MRHASGKNPELLISQALVSGFVTSRRRPRGSAKNAEPLYVRIDPQMNAVADQVAQRLGVSKSDFIEELLRHVELDPDGVPSWWTRPLPEREETLPLTG